ncbi:hypothetical protein NQD34_010866 [Periophthalmus magnuspinnatus]|nr:hypothetical protein NQD34_010866 [Periophthalmus magnuspinnatus]
MSNIFMYTMMGFKFIISVNNIINNYMSPLNFLVCLFCSKDGVPLLCLSSPFSYQIFSHVGSFACDSSSSSLFTFGLVPKRRRSMTLSFLLLQCLANKQQ